MSTRSRWPFSPFVLALAGSVPAFCSAAVSSGAPSADDLSLRTFDVALSRMKGAYYARDRWAPHWDAFREEYRPRAQSADDPAETTAVLRDLLAELGDSHCAILSDDVYRSMMRELSGKRSLTFGAMLEEARSGELFVRSMYEGGPAEEAGLLLGDRVLTIDGVDPFASTSLVDAGYDPALGGTSLFILHGPTGDGISLWVQSDPRGETRRHLRVVPREMSGLDAGRESVKIFQVGTARIGKVHAWFCARGVDDLVRGAVLGPLKDCDALILDLRGRGGFSDVGDRIAELFQGRKGRFPVWSKPVVFLIDRRTRSAKELLSHRIQTQELGPLVGENTEGAVLGAGFFPLPNGTVMELAIVDVPVDGVRLEGVGVPPDVVQPYDYVYAAGRDPILERGLSVAMRELREARARDP